MQPSQQAVNQYITSVLDKFRTDPEKLSKDEKRLAGKYQNEMARLERLNADVGQLRDQIRQGEARLRSLELQTADSQGKTNAFLEYMASLKFEDMEGLPPGSAPQAPTPQIPEGARPESSPELPHESKKSKKSNSERVAA